ncbi:restriction endonuclease subunit S [Spirosoma litoris]
MDYKLADLTDIRFGVYEKPIEIGPIIYLQAKHFTDSGSLKTDQLDSFLSQNNQLEKHLLQKGDVLLVGKGNRIFAWCYHSDIGPAIASTIFFVIRPKLDQILPDYLSTYLNLPACQAYFQQLGAGSSILSIRKNELAELPVLLPNMTTQQHIVNLQQLHVQEIQLLESLILQKQALLLSSINSLLTR